MFPLGTKDSGKIVIYRLIEFNSIQLVVSLKINLRIFIAIIVSPVFFVIICFHIITKRRVPGSTKLSIDLQF